MSRRNTSELWIIPTGCEYNTKSRFSKISITSWKLHFTKLMSSIEGDREEVIGGSGSARGSVGDDSLACMTSYLWNFVMKTRHLSRTSCGCAPRYSTSYTNQSGSEYRHQNKTFREALVPGLKIALTLRHLASGTKYHSMVFRSGLLSSIAFMSFASKKTTIISSASSASFLSFLLFDACDGSNARLSHDPELERVVET